jgi:hypothetical protein
MAFQGGPLAVVGITPEFISTVGTQTSQDGVVQALGQVWQGSGQSFFGSAGQSLGGSLAGVAVNIALNSTLGTSVAGPQGLSLTSGANILASTITPYVTGSIAAGINQNIQQSLQSAGPFGAALSSAGTQITNQIFNGISSTLFGQADLGQGTNYTMFPGGSDDEPPSDYQGSAYTLTDVTFSIQPANQGPQAFGDYTSAFDPKSGTSMGFGDAINADFGIEYPAINSFKFENMQGDFFSNRTGGIG